MSIAGMHVQRIGWFRSGNAASCSCHMNDMLFVPWQLPTTLLVGTGAIRERVLGQNHPDTVATRRALEELAAEGTGRRRAADEAAACLRVPPLPHPPHANHAPRVILLRPVAHLDRMLDIDGNRQVEL